LHKREWMYVAAAAACLKFLQLYAEPSAILYIRTNFNLEDVVIVSPDAGGAKRHEPECLTESKQRC